MMIVMYLILRDVQLLSEMRINYMLLSSRLWYTTEQRLNIQLFRTGILVMLMVRAVYITLLLNVDTVRVLTVNSHGHRWRQDLPLHGNIQVVSLVVITLLLNSTL